MFPDNKWKTNLKVKYSSDKKSKLLQLRVTPTPSSNLEDDSVMNGLEMIFIANMKGCQRETIKRYREKVWMKERFPDFWGFVCQKIKVKSYPEELLLASQLPLQSCCLLPEIHFLTMTSSIIIDYGWGSMTLIWNGTDLRMTHALPKIPLNFVIFGDDFVTFNPRAHFSVTG